MRARRKFANGVVGRTLPRCAGSPGYLS
jgi:hypothetical protein